MSETIKITDITPARYNPRKISETEYKKLTNSINEYGLVDPIIINLNNNHIIGGHQRYDVLLEQYVNGDTDYEELELIRRGDIGWIFPKGELTVKDLNHEKSLNIALNKIQGEWDGEKLEDLFNDLIIEGLDIELTGFSKDEAKDIFKDLDFNGFDDELNSPEESTQEEPKRKTILCPECHFEWEA